MPLHLSVWRLRETVPMCSGYVACVTRQWEGLYSIVHSMRRALRFVHRIYVITIKARSHMAPVYCTCVPLYLYYIYPYRSINCSTICTFSYTTHGIRIHSHGKKSHITFTHICRDTLACRQRGGGVVASVADAIIFRTSYPPSDHQCSVQFRRVIRIVRKQCTC